jgi:hypothetical protein
MKAIAINLSRSGASVDRRVVRRIALVVVTALFTLLAFYLHSLASAHHASARDAASRAAWQSSGNTAAAISLDAFVATWAAQRAKSAEQTTLSWSVRDARDLRASLLALDATRVAVQRVNVNKRDNGYSVSVEASP